MTAQKPSRKPAAFVIAPEEEERPSARAGAKPRTKKAAKGAKDAREAKTASGGRGPAAIAPVRVVEEKDAFAPPALSGEQDAQAQAQARRAGGLSRAFRWGRVLLSAASGLVMLWAGAALTGLIEDLFARSPVLGWTAAGLAALAGMAALIIIGRELAGLVRLRRVTRLHNQAQAAMAANDEAGMKKLLSRLRALYAGREDMRWAMERLETHEEALMKPAERLDLAERELLAPLDERAKIIIAATSRQVAVMTAVIPMATLDIAAVALQNLKMLRRLATLYGGRPGALGGLKLGRMVLTHLALTGSLALTDNVVQHVLGKGLAGRLSARFGEGAVNGILTARIGIAATTLVRPLPHRAAPAPKLADFARTLFSKDKETR